MIIMLHKKFIFLFVFLVLLSGNINKLFSFDHSSKPFFIAIWTLDKTVPDFPTISKDNPTYGSRANKRYNNTTELQLYKNSNEVAIYSPGTRYYFVIPAKNYDAAYNLYQEIAIRLTYYFAKDRTTDIYGEDTPKQYRGGEHNIRGGEMFFNYIYQSEGYGENQIHNKYKQDPLTVILDYTEFLTYIRNFSYQSRYDYLDNHNLDGMKKYISKVYTSETILNNWHLTF